MKLGTVTTMLLALFTSALLSTSAAAVPGAARIQDVEQPRPWREIDGLVERMERISGTLPAPGPRRGADDGNSHGRWVVIEIDGRELWEGPLEQARDELTSRLLGDGEESPPSTRGIICIRIYAGWPAPDRFDAQLDRIECGPLLG